MNEILQTLFSLKDENYAAFHSNLIPNISKDKVIGVRVPLLKKYAKEVANTAQCEEFINHLPHTYYDENTLHSILINDIKDFNVCIFQTERFLPYIDNWATCDILKPKIFKNNTDKLLPYINVWLKSKHTFTVRFAIRTMLGFYLDENFHQEHLYLISSITTEEYYIKMAQAWYFATALSKHYESVLPILTHHLLDKWTHNKTIQKAIESFLITDNQKTYLKTLKRQE